LISSIQNFYRALRDRYAGAANPVGFARSLGVSVGDGVHFYGVDRGMFGSEPWMIRIGDNSHITAGVQFITHDGGTLVLRKEVPDLEWSAPITVGSDVYIGMRTMVLPGVNIGNRCIIGAGTVLTKSIPANCVVAGVPGRIIKSTDDYLENLKAKSLRCGHLRGNAKDQILRTIYPEFGNCSG
jgi:acetyltransferase-like isoleucine patch superfamily enzyme